MRIEQKTKQEETKEQKQLNRGAFSIVYRPPLSLQQQTSYVVKRPIASLPQQKRQKIMRSYMVQKQILDYLYEKNPTKSSLFNKIYQITQHHVKMKDLGDTDLSTLFSEHPDWLSHDLDNVIAQIVDAFLTIWKSSIVHRDIKMENLMARYNPETHHIDISVIDFADSLPRPHIEKHHSFSFAGTPCFMSPELLVRIYSKPPNKSPGTWREYVANDLWALGLMLYYLIYGKHLCNMFKDMFFGKRVPTPQKLYQDLKNWPDRYNDLFPTDHLPENKKQYVPMLRRLLSFDPNDRIRWLNEKVRQQQKQQLSSPSKKSRKQ